jgi:hypothetical protein
MQNWRTKKKRSCTSYGSSKAFVKEDGGNNRRPAALQHFVDHRAQPWRKGYVAHNAYGKRINTTPSLLSRTTEKGLWIRQLTIISTVHKNMVSFCQREKISAKESWNSGHDRKSERRKIDFYQNDNCVFKNIKRWKHYLFTS